MSTLSPNMDISEAAALSMIGRLVGQDCLFQDFDIEVDSNGYQICVIKPSRDTGPPKADESDGFMKWTKQSLATQPDDTAWTTACVRQDLAQLSAYAQGKSQGLPTEADPFTGSEFLKAAGACLDESYSRLRRLSRKDERILLAYETPLGVLQIEEYLVDWLRNRAVALWWKAELTHHPSHA